MQFIIIKGANLIGIVTMHGPLLTKVKPIKCQYNKQEYNYRPS